MKLTRLSAVVFACLFASPAMAAQRVWISEFAVLGGAQNGTPQIAALPSVADQPVLDTTSGVKTSAAFNPRTQYIRVCVEAQSAIALNATATTASMPIPAGSCEYFGVQVNTGSTLSVIANP